MDEAYEQDSLFTEEHAIEEVLKSDLDPVSKVRQIMGFGVEEDVANDLVYQYQMGKMTPAYYERLEEFYDDEAA